MYAGREAEEAAVGDLFAGPHILIRGLLGALPQPRRAGTRGCRCAKFPASCRRSRTCLGLRRAVHRGAPVCATRPPPLGGPRPRPERRLLPASGARP